MRDHDIDIPAPDFSDGGVMDLGKIDAEDEGYEAAHDDCRAVFTGSGIDLPGS
jgi:hypothetical protein